MINPKINLPDFSQSRVLVVGDVMLDRYWFGEVSRISPEAPVPVVNIARAEERPGGAANVARNVVALGAQAQLLSVLGTDEAGACLQQLMAENGIPASLQMDGTIRTTVKLRVIGRQQQLLRIDFETLPSHEVLRAKMLEYKRLLPECDVVLLSDYGKGGLTHISEMIELARQAGKKILVDPKGDDYSRYLGATMITPNKAELRQVVGRWNNEDDLAARAEALRERLELEAVLVTRSEEGMSLYRKDEVLHEPALAREVYDVSGAGDTVIATMAAMLAAGSEWKNAVRAANLAGSIVVGKFGTAVVSREEINLANETGALS